MDPLLRRVLGRAADLRRQLGSAASVSVPLPILASSGAIGVGIVVVVALTVGGGPAHSSQMPPEPLAASHSPSAAALPGGAVRPFARFSGVILPDLLVVLPSGLTHSDLAGLRAIKGVRDMITFDGAQITVAGSPASVIGVSPGRFRSWVPLSAASDQLLWSNLAAGQFIASASAATRLGLTKGLHYQLSGRSAQTVTFEGAAALGVAGIDLVVNQAVSRKLGLVRRVAALISAPGPSMPALLKRVNAVLGRGARVLSLRGESLPLTGSGPTRPGEIASYVQLFQASAAKYCPTLSWTVLAAIGQIESGDGKNIGPSSAGALGPMQFLPSTWAAWGIDGFGPAGPPDVLNPLDAVPSAARMLCADGASDGTQAGLRQAIFDYNHATWYVNEVLALAREYAAEFH